MGLLTFVTCASFGLLVLWGGYGLASLCMFGAIVPAPILFFIVVGILAVTELSFLTCLAVHGHRGRLADESASDGEKPVAPAAVADPVKEKAPKNHEAVAAAASKLTADNDFCCEISSNDTQEFVGYLRNDPPAQTSEFFPLYLQVSGSSIFRKGGKHYLCDTIEYVGIKLNSPSVQDEEYNYLMSFYNAFTREGKFTQPEALRKKASALCARIFFEGIKRQNSTLECRYTDSMEILLSGITIPNEKHGNMLACKKFDPIPDNYKKKWHCIHTLIEAASFSQLTNSATINFNAEHAFDTENENFRHTVVECCSFLDKMEHTGKDPLELNPLLFGILAYFRQHQTSSENLDSEALAAWKRCREWRFESSSDRRKLTATDRVKEVELLISQQKDYGKIKQICEEYLANDIKKFTEEGARKMKEVCLRLFAWTQKSRMLGSTSYEECSLSEKLVNLLRAFSTKREITKVEYEEKCFFEKLYGAGFFPDGECAAAASALSAKLKFVHIGGLDGKGNRSVEAPSAPTLQPGKQWTLPCSNEGEQVDHSVKFAAQEDYASMDTQIENLSAGADFECFREFEIRDRGAWAKFGLPEQRSSTVDVVGLKIPLGWYTLDDGMPVKVVELSANFEYPGTAYSWKSTKKRQFAFTVDTDQHLFIAPVLANDDLAIQCNKWTLIPLSEQQDMETRREEIQRLLWQ
ncbi:MAG: hypothetical protein LBS68_00980 [Puniceicoccales bacterium]|nr:hypothetical protein [Puniceicoccales bacterium]